MVSLLRVLSIYHVTLCLPLRWLAGNCGDLEEFGFGVADMPMAVDLMDDVFGEIVEDGDLLLDEDYMMNVFKSLAVKIPPFEEYLTYMFDFKQSSPV